ncbi:sugar transferase [Ruminococcus sp.]|uniref:sugar transferase n=1 Tax=Ruminococcus sp. TaxID=41978 RepID=UPI0025F6C8C9|nr:sugar transferase [Ruminococcus sp.]
MYAKYFKRMLDFTLSLGAIIVLSPILLVLTIVGVVAMGGNPFFTQDRPGKNEKIFKLVKFRTMNNKKDKHGNLLSDEKRLTSYGKWLRSTSLDELPELFNIIIGDMSIIGPRPLLPRDVKYMNSIQNRRHLVRPGLTGLAQSSGRNALNWDEKLKYDVEYINNISFSEDIKILFRTVKKVFLREDTTFAEGADMDLKDWNELKNKSL